jgi:hypothetical protein
MKKEKEPYIDPLTLMQRHNHKYFGKYTRENHPLRAYPQPWNSNLSEEDRPTTYAVYCTLCDQVHPHQSLEERETIWKEHSPIFIGNAPIRRLNPRLPWEETPHDIKNIIRTEEKNHREITNTDGTLWLYGNFTEVEEEQIKIVHDNLKKQIEVIKKEKMNI